MSWPLTARLYVIKPKCQIGLTEFFDHWNRTGRIKGSLFLKRNLIFDAKISSSIFGPNFLSNTYRFKFPTYSKKMIIDFIRTFLPIIRKDFDHAALDLVFLCNDFDKAQSLCACTVNNYRRTKVIFTCIRYFL